MKASEALIAWTPADDGDVWPNTAGKVRVGPLIAPDAPDWTAEYRMTGGAAFTRLRSLKGAEARSRLFIDFHTLVVRDGINPHEAHKAFLVIDEYRRFISPDIDGAE